MFPINWNYIFIFYDFYELRQKKSNGILVHDYFWRTLKSQQTQNILLKCYQKVLKMLAECFVFGGISLF